MKKPRRYKVTCCQCHLLRIVHFRPALTKEEEAKFLATPYVCSDHLNPN